MNALHRRCPKCGACKQCDKTHPWGRCQVVVDRKAKVRRWRNPSKGWAPA